MAPSALSSSLSGRADSCTHFSRGAVVPTDGHITGKFTFPGSTPGEYEVGFTQQISNCVPVASVHARPLRPEDAAFATVSFTSGSQVGVSVFAPNGTPVDGSFDLIVAC